MVASRASHGMSEIHTFFRVCPKCGKRFEIRITGKKLVDERVANNNVQVNPAIKLSRGVGPLLMSEGVTTVDTKEFQYAYECKHCGHIWAELVDKYDESTSWKQPPKL